MPDGAPVTIEEVLKLILGYTLGAGESATNLPPPPSTSTQAPAPAPGAATTIDSSLRPATIRESGPAWLVPSDRGERWTANQGWKPGFKKGALTFWRRMGDTAFANWEWLTVQVTNQNVDNGSRNSGVETGDKTDPVTTIGNAWRAAVENVPKLAGRDTPFDPGTLRAINEGFAAMGVWSGNVFADLDNDISRLDTKQDNFQGSASEAFRDRVRAARRGVQGVQDGAKPWNTPMTAAVDRSNEFVTTLINNTNTWKNTHPAGAWTHPLQLIISMLNGAVVREVEDPGGNYNRSGDLWETGRVKGAGSTSTLFGNQTPQTYKTMIITFPAWSGVTGDFDVLRTHNWVEIDRQVRKAWADKVEEVFKPTVTKAAEVITAIDAANTAMKLARMPPEKPARPPKAPPGMNLNGINNNFNQINNNMNSLALGMGNGLNTLASGMSNNMNSLALGMGNNLNTLAGGMSNNMNSLALGMGNGMNGLNDGLSKSVSGLGNGLNRLGGPMDPETLGDLTREQLSGLDDQGLLDETPLTDEQRAALNEAGLGAGGAKNLGDLNPAQLAALQSAGLLNNVPLSQTQTSGLLKSGLMEPGQGMDDLGDLSPKQLEALSQAGLLDDVPLTDEDLAELRKQGLLDSSSGVSNLGDLDAEQLGALQDAGLLDDVPVTQAQIGALDDAGLLGATDGSVRNLGDLSPVQLATVDSSGILDDVPVTPEQLDQLRRDGLLGADATGLDALGDLSPAQLEDLRAADMLDDVPVTSAGLAALDEAGLLGSPDNLSSSLGDLTSEQLAGLDDARLLDDDALTPRQLQELQESGIDTAGLDTLGDLDAGQLEELSEAELLDGVPTSPEQLSELGLDGVGGLGDGTASNPFPTTIDGLDINDRPDSLNIPGVDVGDVTSPVAKPVPGSLSGGFNSGGLTLPPGVGGGGGLSSSVGGGAGAGGLGGGLSGGDLPDSAPIGSGAGGMRDVPPSGVPTGPVGSGSVGAPGGIDAGMGGMGGGMPFMPMGGMGGGGGGAPQGKERERNTWLTEDEDVWGTDPECAPAVIGRAGTDDGDGGQGFEQESRPERPGAPTRTPRRGRG
jgi:hypothetical protein